jgi:dephospho-CoA kinase
MGKLIVLAWDRRSKQNVIVIEAIKLLESPLRQGCDSLWVSYAPPEVQVTRLVQKRGMSEEAARQRINVQSPQEAKIAAANVVIRNIGSYEDTWRQVWVAWQKLFPDAGTAILRTRAAPGKLVVERARPRQADEIAAFINRMNHGQQKLGHEDVMAAFGEKAYLLLRMDDRLVGLVGWQVENLVARTDEVYLESSLVQPGAFRQIMEEIEHTSRDLQCEVSLLFIPEELAKQAEVWKSLGYEPRRIESLGVRAWQEAAQESMPAGMVLFFKQLRKDRVLRPV